MQIYDISLPIDPALASWPGDTPFTLEWISTKSQGEPVNLGSIKMSPHLGTHADAPYHFDSFGASIDQLSLGPFIGPATVIDLAGKQVINVGDLDRAVVTSTPRLLIKTGAWKDYSQFPEDIPLIAADVPEHLRRCGVILLGLDLASVDAIYSKDLANHHAIHANGIHILESLFLKDVPPGQYELIALPLRLVGADASPVRAILRSLD